VTPVNNGTGSLVSIPIPGGSGLSITVGQGTAALPLQNINTMTDAVNVRMGDDGWHDVALPFSFPYWNQTFNQSTMYSNGAVQFGRPVGNNWPSWNNAFCCHGEDLKTLSNTGYNYSIMALWTDLQDFTNATTYYRGTTDSMTYGWYNQSQYGRPGTSNTFEIKINSTGVFDVRYGGTYIAPSNFVTIGMTGDVSKGEYVQLYNALGLSGQTAGFSWGALNGTGGVDMCMINPLSSPTCSGYQAAYTTQQCTISALYDPSCPGYAQAYHDQQCSVNPLFASDCVGYASAYLNQQCSINSLYSTDCPGYAAAYLDQQCTLNPLYSTTCSGYAQAYFDQQCSLNGLYDRACPNYSTAYATKMLLEQQNLATTVATAGVVASTAPTTTVSSDGTVSTPTTVSSTGNTTVDKAISTTTTTTNSASAPAAPVQLVQAPPAPTSPTSPQSQQTEKKQEDKPAEKKPDGDKPGAGPTQMAAPQESSNKEQPKTARQEIQEKRQEAAKREAVEKGKNLANEVGKASDLEAQKQIQNVVIQAMGFTPGFDSYSKQLITQTQFYKPFTVYNNQKNIENRATLRMFGGADRLHTEMVDLQYKKDE